MNTLKCYKRAIPILNYIKFFLRFIIRVVLVKRPLFNTCVYFAVITKNINAKLMLNIL